MKKFFGLLFINLALVLLQISFFGELFGGSFVPNLVLALAFAFMFCELGSFGKTSAFLGGILLDFLGFNIVGISSLVFLGCILIYEAIRRNVSKNVFISAIFVVLTALVYDRVLGNTSHFFGAEGLNGALFTLVVCGIFYILVSGFSTYLAKSGYKIEE